MLLSKKLFKIKVFQAAMKRSPAVSAMLLSAWVASGQSFEVASIKTTQPSGMSRYGRIEVRGGRFTAKETTLTELIVDAFGVEPYQIADGPKWIGADKYDVDARAVSVPSREEFRLMEQAMVRERFQLRFHRQSRELAVYGMLVAKGGPKFKEGPSLMPPWPKDHVYFKDLAAVAAAFARFLDADRPVIDETGLTGQYTLSVDSSEFKDPDRRGGRTVQQFYQQAILEQLGLKLVTAKARIDMFVIDVVEKASAN